MDSQITPFGVGAAMAWWRDDSSDTKRKLGQPMGSYLHHPRPLALEEIEHSLLSTHDSITSRFTSKVARFPTGYIISTHTTHANLLCPASKKLYSPTAHLKFFLPFYTNWLMIAFSWHLKYSDKPLDIAHLLLRHPHSTTPTPKTVCIHKYTSIRNYSNTVVT